MKVKIIVSRPIFVRLFSSSYFSVVMRFVFASVLSSVVGLENNVARTPPMGFISWQRFGAEINCKEFPDTCISEKLYLEIAQAMSKKGLTAAGYVYVNIDDNWSQLDSNRLEDRTRFPNGISSLSEHIGGLGMKLGMYSDIGTKTCQGYVALNMDEPGNHAAATQFIDQLIDWRVEYLKVDGCNADISHFKTTYPQLSDLIMARLKEKNAQRDRKTTPEYKPILLSCSWPAYEGDHGVNVEDLALLRKYCNTWRNQGDITDDWGTIRGLVNWYASKSTKSDDLLVSAAGPGHWNDPDMLVIGNNGLSIEQQKTQFNLWAVMAAPLYISADVRTMTDESLEILKNQKVIAINQDALGRQGWVIHFVPDVIRVWMRPLTPDDEGHERVAVLFESLRVAFNKMKYILLLNKLGWGTDLVSWSAEDCYSEKVRRAKGRRFTIKLDENTSQMYVFTKFDGDKSDYPSYQFDVAGNLPQPPRPQLLAPTPLN